MLLHRPVNEPRNTPASVVWRGCAQGTRRAARAAGDGRVRADGRASGAHGRDVGARAERAGVRASRTGASRCHGDRPATTSNKTAASSRPPPCQALGGIAPRRSTRSAAGTSAHAGAPRAGTNRHARVPTPFPIATNFPASVFAMAASAFSHPIAQKHCLFALI